MEKNYVNMYDVTIVKCCASCKNCAYDTKSAGATNVLRICNKGEGIVKGSSYCKEWAMREGLNNAGKGGGKVKKPAYIDFLRYKVKNTPPAEYAAELLDVWRREFMRETGTSIFI